MSALFLCGYVLPMAVVVLSIVVAVWSAGKVDALDGLLFCAAFVPLLNAALALFLLGTWSLLIIAAVGANRRREPSTPPKKGP